MSNLKKCPVCGSACFSDMDICYGCLHRFGKDEPVVFVGAEGAHQSLTCDDIKLVSDTKMPVKSEALESSSNIQELKLSDEDLKLSLEQALGLERELGQTSLNAVDGLKALCKKNSAQAEKLMSGSGFTEIEVSIRIPDKFIALLKAA